MIGGPKCEECGGWLSSPSHSMWGCAGFPLPDPHRERRPEEYCPQCSCPWTDYPHSRDCPNAAALGEPSLGVRDTACRLNCYASEGRAEAALDFHARAKGFRPGEMEIVFHGECDAWHIVPIEGS